MSHEERSEGIPVQRAAENLRASTPPMARRLLLWDIDGTLIHSDGAGLRSLDRAARSLGLSGLGGIDCAGRTDAWIARQILERDGIDPTPAKVGAFLDAYLGFLKDEIQTAQGRVLEGVADALEFVRSRPPLVQALLTGNLAAGAKIKLQHYRLWHYFEFGAFSDDSADRNELGTYAVRRLHEHRRWQLAPRDVIVIGDTPHDIACGRAIGARTVAIATGRYRLEQLAACNPDLCLENLGDPEPLFTFIEPPEELEA